MNEPSASPALPQGTWQNLLAGGLQSTAKLEIVPGGDPASPPRYRATSRVLTVSNAVFKDCIVRGRFNGSWGNSPILIVRYDRSRPTTYVSIACNNYSATLRSHFVNGYRPAGSSNMDAPLMRDQPTNLELKVEGDAYTFSRDGKVVLQQTIPYAPMGNVGFNIDENTIVESFEVMSLDGVALDAPPVAGAPTAVPQSGGSVSPSADPRLAQLEAGFQARYATDAQKPYDTGLEALNQSYVANGIARVRAQAQAQGSLPEVMALDAEKAAVEGNKGVPAEDAPDTPPGLKALRVAYRSALARIEDERGKKAAPLYDMYLTALDAYVAELTRANKTAEALKVKSLRDEIAAKRPKGTAQPESAGRSTAVTTGSSPANPAKQGEGAYDVTLDWVPSGFNTGEGYRPQRTDLSKRKPASVSKVPDDLSKNAQYATLLFGSAKDEVKVTALLDEEAPDKSRLWVDANGNGDLTDDPDVGWTGKAATPGSEFIIWYGGAKILVRFGRQERELGMRFYRFDKRERTEDQLYYYRDFGLSGEGSIAGKTYKMRVGDHTARGDFMNSTDSYLKIDVNGDGRFDRETETFGFMLPFVIDGVPYEVAGLEPGGNTFQIRDTKGRRR